MTTWFTSDLHFGHANIIEYSGRPFRDVGHMNRALIERWNELVQPADTVWVLGDVAMGRIVDTLPLVRQLAGRKLLLAGNHDRCWDGHGPKAAEWLERYEDAGFEEIRQGTIKLEAGTTYSPATSHTAATARSWTDIPRRARSTRAGGWCTVTSTISGVNRAG